MNLDDVLKANIVGLLARQNRKPAALAKWLHMTPSWAGKALKPSYALKPGEIPRNIPVKHLDRIAEFFRVQPCQLITPGYAANASDRRSGRDRRIKERRSGIERRRTR